MFCTVVFTCDQETLFMIQSVPLFVRPSDCPSVCHTFSLCSNHRIIMKFSGVVTIYKRDVHAKGQDRRQRSKSQRSKQILPKFECFRTVTRMYINRFLCNNRQSYRSALLFFKVIRLISRSQGKEVLISTRIRRFRTGTTVSIYRLLRHDAHSLKWHGRGALFF